ncbi:hypothetical protein C2U70_04760 [Bradyrhizobium guangdongense]|uniref:hypothetical protein n=1 Tax=Bradyrhizobium guangdongense TaxID=1325090 RepID=UPI0011283717|nr:hypothetical protein [Bradyrhizobium guangdongense]TPQ40621.1 hypothetical protein C2U70_04760 [Bradyrhizobium guangdongense]
MSIVREIMVAVVGVCALVWACDTMFLPGRFDEAYFDRAMYAPGQHEFRLAGVSPSLRISEAFAQLPYGQARARQRYSSLTTIVR